jgi:hypothetical protein
MFTSVVVEAQVQVMPLVVAVELLEVTVVPLVVMQVLQEHQAVAQALEDGVLLHFPVAQVILRWLVAVAAAAAVERECKTFMAVVVAATNTEASMVRA